MKEITDKFRNKHIEELMESFSEKEVKTKINGQEVKISKRYVLAFEKRIKYFETENIEDIHKNYLELTRNRGVGIITTFLGIKEGLKIMRKNPEIIRDNKNEEDENYCFNESKNPLKMNLNMGFIDNIYVDNFKFIKRNSYKSCKFDIKDIKGDFIRGAFVYESKTNQDNENKKAQLEKILNSDGASPFDIVFMALNKKFEKNEKRIYLPKERKLLVIEFKDKNKNDENHTPYNENLPETILELLGA